MFRIFVDDPHRTKYVTYPAAGQPLYTRQEAKEIMERMKAKGMQHDVWAESESERFDLEDY